MSTSCVYLSVYDKSLVVSLSSKSLLINVNVMKMCAKLCPAPEKKCPSSGGIVQGGAVVRSIRVRKPAPGGPVTAQPAKPAPHPP